MTGMKAKKIKTTLILLLGLGVSSAANAIYEITCPDTIEVKSIPTELETLPDGWQITEQKNMLLHVDSGEVYSDRPINLGQLIPFTVTIEGKKYKNAWLIDDNSWFNCSYQRNRVRLIKQVDPSMKTCWVIFEKDAKGHTKVKLNCDKVLHDGPKSYS